MSKKRTKTTSVAVVLLAGACAPMEQAPLVYSSAQTIGVEVSAGEPESPAFDLVIGYAGKDRAFVPVAVAKVCRASSASHKDCLRKIFEKEIITGRNSVNGGNKQGEGSLQYVDKKLRGLQAQKASAEKRLQGLKRDRDEITNLEDRKNELASLKSSEGNADNPRALELEGQINYLETLSAKYSGGKPSAEIEAAERELTTLAAAIIEASAQISALMASGETLNVDVKEDAFSVYGSFDGNAKGDSSSGEIGVGKVFSTGVAAQNLTQGLGRAAIASAAGTCIEKGMPAVMLLAEAARPAQAQKLLQTCQARELTEKD